MSRADLHRLVDELPDDAIDGTITLLQKVVVRQLDPDQLWFWTPEWQEGEREADVELAAGQGTIYQSDEEFLAALEADLKPLP
jgi:hypothetical protein